MILVFAESIEGNFKKSTYEAVSYAASFAQSSGVLCTAVSIGNVEDSRLNELFKYGADKVISVNQDWLQTFNPESFSKVICNIAGKENATLVVVSNTYSGKSLAPRIAAGLKAGIVSGVISIPDTSNGFKVRKTVFSGKAYSDVTIHTPVKVLALTPNTFALTESTKSANLVKEDGGITTADIISKSLEVSRTTGKVVLTEAEVVVSGGRGMKGPENWGMIEELAETLGAATACSKPVSDMDWRPHSEHVGQTGITIKPNLYIAIGISGAIQHLAGVSSSKVIVAINKDAEAPFFKAADYGIVGDAFEVLPKLIEAAKKLKSQHA